MIVYHVNEFKNSVAAVLKADEFSNKTFVGVAHCSSKDSFDEKIGCDLAKDRAIKKLEKYKLSILKKRQQKVQKILRELNSEIIHKEAKLAEIDIDIMNILATLED